MSLKCPKTAAELLDMYYLEARCHLLETASMFDRLQRADGYEDIKNDPRYRRLVNSLEVLASGDGQRAKNFLELFSDEGEQA